MHVHEHNIVEGTPPQREKDGNCNCNSKTVDTEIKMTRKAGVDFQCVINSLMALYAIMP